MYIKEEDLMQFVIVVYRSRNVTMQAYNFVTRRGITASVVSTPRSVNVGCGLSLKMPRQALDVVGETLEKGETFVGFFLVQNTARGMLLTRL